MAKSKSSLSRRQPKPRELSPNETAVQDVLAKAKRPLGAYDIIPLMSKSLGHSVAPVTVYRALLNLAALGLVTRIETKNAYILCQHPQKTHECLFFICRSCGNALEAPDTVIGHVLHKEAKKLGFDINKQILEVVGLCEACSRNGSKRSPPARSGKSRASP